MKFLNLFSPSKGGKRTSRSAPGPRRTVRPATARGGIIQRAVGAVRRTVAGAVKGFRGK